MPEKQNFEMSIANQIMSLPSCANGSGIKMDVSQMTDDGQRSVIPFIGPSNSGVLFNLVFNPKGVFIGFGKDNRTHRLLDITDGKIDEDNLQWIDREISKRTLNLRSMVIRLMKSEKTMESRRGVPYYEQFPKVSLRQMVDPYLLHNLAKALAEKNGQKITKENEQQFKADVEANSEKYLKAIYTDALSMVLQEKGFPINEEIIDTAYAKNRVEFVKLLQKGIKPFKSVKYLFNKDSEVENIDIDDIVVIDVRTKKQCTLGNPTDAYMISLLTRPLNRNSSLLVDVGYMQGGHDVMLFYRIGISDSNVYMTRYTNPDENGDQRRSSVKSHATLEDFGGLNDWVESTVSSTIEVDNDIKDVRPGNVNLFIDDIDFIDEQSYDYPDKLAPIFNKMKSNNLLFEQSLVHVPTDYSTDGSVIEADVVNLPSTRGDIAIAFTVSNVSDISTPVVILSPQANDEYSTNEFVNVDFKTSAELRFVSAYNGKYDYASKEFDSISNATVTAQNLCLLYLSWAHFREGLEVMLDTMLDAKETHFNLANIHARMAVTLVNDPNRAFATIYVWNDLVASDKMRFDISVTNDNEGTRHIGFSYRDSSISLVNHPIQFKSLMDELTLGFDEEDSDISNQNILSVMSDPENEYFKVIEQILYPIVTGTEYGGVKNKLEPDAISASKIRQQADLKRKSFNVIHAEPQVDQSNAVEKLEECRDAFDRTFVKYGVNYNLSKTLVSRSQYDRSIIGASFVVDNGSSGSFVAIPLMNPETKQKTGDSRVYYKTNNRDIPVEYNDSGELTFSDKFLNKFFNVSGKLQSTIKSKSQYHRSNS